MTEFADEFDQKLKELDSAGVLSKKGTGRFKSLIPIISEHLDIVPDEIYVVACARPNNLNIRLSQGRSQHRHNSLGLGVLSKNAFSTSQVESGMKAAASFIGTGNAQYDAVGVVLLKDDKWVIGGMVESTGAGIAAKLMQDFPEMLTDSVEPKTTRGQSPLLSDDPSAVEPAVEDDDLRFRRRFEIDEESRKGKSELPVQVLFHGCPGSGKSFTLNEWAASVSKSITVVLHPETTYSDFVGVFRPFPVYKLTEDEFFTSSGAIFEEGEPYITYRFVAGPLLEAYCYAIANPDESVALIIEELSRANASLVFGDMLQLLDRATDGSDAGSSAYGVTPKREIQEYLDRFNLGLDGNEMRFPANLHIWATMNRSDQNARQLDAAFLRRWKKKHLSFSTPCSYGGDPVAVPGGATIAWDTLRARINGRLVDFAPEDKFIGPYFLPRVSLSDPETVAEDLLGYLWNDVLKSRSREFFAFPTLTEVMAAWIDGNANPFIDIELT